MKIIYNEEGIGGFFKGIYPSLALTVNPVIQFIIYEYLRIKCLDSNNEISGLNVIVISLISKLITTIVTYPMLIIKTFFQVNENKTNKEIYKIIYNIYNEKGCLGFYKGKF